MGQEIYFSTNETNNIISKTLPINKNGTLEITNKYGSVIITTWEKDFIDINIKLNAYDINGNKLEKLKQNLSVKFDGNSTYQRIYTNHTNSSFTKELIEATNIQLLPNNHSIEYIICIPKDINLNINNKYGNIVIPSIDGNVNIDLSNGDLIADELNGSSTLDLSFGNATINYANKLNLNLNHYATTIKQSNNISLNSNSSNLDINNVLNIVGSATRGKLKIQKVNYAQINSQYSSFLIQELTSKAHIDIKYGALYINNLSINTKLITINSIYSGITINLNKTSGYIFNMDCETDTSNFPSEIIWDVNTNKSNHTHGTLRNKNNATDISITSRKSNIKIN